MTLAKPGSSSGPAARAASGPIASTKTATARAAAERVAVMVAVLPLRQHVGPDALPPALRALRDGDALGGRELLLDLDHLVVLDLVRVHHRDGLFVADPAVAGVAGRHGSRCWVTLATRRGRARSSTRCSGSRRARSPCSSACCS